LIIVLIQRIEAYHPQIRRQPAEVDISDEAHFAERYRPEPDERRNIDGFEHRVDADFVPVLYTVGEIDTPIRF